MQASLLSSSEDGIFLFRREHSTSRKETLIWPPVSVVICLMRGRLNRGWGGTRPSTRFGFSSAAKEIGGNGTAAAPVPPVRMMFASHSEGLVPSWGSAQTWVRSQVSTVTGAELTYTWVEILVSRLVVKNEGPLLVQVPVEPQTWSSGTSGQEPALALVRLLSAQAASSVGRHRSETLNVTVAAGLRAPLAVICSGSCCP